MPGILITLLVGTADETGEITVSVDYRLIGKRIGERRRQEKKTQENLAEGLGVSVGYISQIERGVTKANLDTLSEIAGLLGGDVVEFLGGAMPGRGEYLTAELHEAWDRTNDRQRRLILDIIRSLLEYEEQRNNP